MNRIAAAPNSEHGLLPLIQRSLSWEYFGGSRYQRVCHPETGWRRLPFLVVVCPTEGKYLSKVDQMERFEIGAGEALVVPEGVPHTVSMPRKGVLHHAHIRYSIFGSIDILRFYKVPPVIRGKAAKQIGIAVAQLHEEMEGENREPAAYEVVERAIRGQRLSGEILGLITSHSKLRESRDGSILDISKMRPVFQYIDDNLAKSISRGELAQLLSLSETRFHAVFQAGMGMSPMAYLRSVRMQRARLLLARSELRIAEIGERVGYSDIFHFSKVFKNAAGMSPLSYRKQLRQWTASPFLR